MIIQSIPSIREKITATIIPEIGEIERFNHDYKRKVNQHAHFFSIA